MKTTIKLIITIITVSVMAMLTGCSGGSGNSNVTGNTKVGMKVVFANSSSVTANSLGATSVLLNIYPLNPAITLATSSANIDLTPHLSTGKVPDIVLPDPVSPATSEPYLFRITAWNSSNKVIYCGQTLTRITAGNNSISLTALLLNGFDSILGTYTISASDGTKVAIPLTNGGMGSGTSSGGSYVTVYASPNSSGSFDVVFRARSSSNTFAAHGKGSFDAVTGAGSGTGTDEATGAAITWTSVRNLPFTSAMISGKSFDYSDTLNNSGAITFNADGTVTGFNGSWLISTTGQLKIHNTGTSTDYTLTLTGSTSTTYTAFESVSNGTNGTMTFTLWQPAAAPHLTAIAVTPANQSKTVGATQQYTATGTYSDNSTQNLTSSVTWSSSANSIATIATTGVATAVASGSATIIATMPVTTPIPGNITGSTSLAVTAGVATTTAAWSQTGGPPGTTGGMSFIALDPGNAQTIYVSTVSGGFFKSPDGGTTWSSAIIPTGTVISSIAVTPNNSQVIYVGTTNKGLFKTSDGGVTWNVINTGITTNPITSQYNYVSGVKVDRTNSNIVYAANNGNGIYKSTDGGANWTLNTFVGLSNPGFSGFNSSLMIDPTNNLTLYVATSTGLYKSTDGGVSWGPINTGLTSQLLTSIAIDPTNSQNVYVAISGRGVFKSTNGGANWAASITVTGLTSLIMSEIIIDPTNSQTLYAGTAAGVFKSTDGGASWTAINGGITQTNVAALAIDPTNSQTVYAGLVGGGVYKTTTGGQ